MLESFGARLRQQREQHGIDLVAIAEQTKIKRSLLEALERDDLSQWPSGIFRRAYVRNYAQAIGLDPDATVQLFLQVHPEAVEVAALAEIASLADGARPTNGSASTRLRTMMGSALGSFSLFRRHASPEEASAAEPAPAFSESAYTLTLRPPMPGSPTFYDQCETLAEERDARESPDAIALPEPIGEWPDTLVEMPEPLAGTEQAAELQPAVEAPAVTAARPEPEREPAIDLLAVARLCTEFSRVGEASSASRQT